MKVTIILFGRLTDIADASSITVEDVVDTNNLVMKLQEAYPALISARYVIAVDKNIVKENTILSNNCIVALLPPFSGG